MTVGRIYDLVKRDRGYASLGHALLRSSEFHAHSQLLVALEDDDDDGDSALKQDIAYETRTQEVLDFCLDGVQLCFGRTRLFSRTGLAFGSILSSWTITSGLIPCVSEGLHTNTFALLNINKVRASGKTMESWSMSSQFLVR